MVTPSSRTIRTGSTSGGKVTCICCITQPTMRVASRYAVPAQASVASGAPGDRKKNPTIRKMASTVAISTQTRCWLMMTPCS